MVTLRAHIVVLIAALGLLGSCVHAPGGYLDKSITHPEFRSRHIGSIAVIPVRHEDIKPEDALASAEHLAKCVMDRDRTINTVVATELDTIPPAELVSRTALTGNFSCLLITRISNAERTHGFDGPQIQDMSAVEKTLRGNPQLGKAMVVATFLLIETATGDTLWFAECKGHATNPTGGTYAPEIAEAFEYSVAEAIRNYPF